MRTIMMSPVFHSAAAHARVVNLARQRSWPDYFGGLADQTPL